MQPGWISTMASNVTIVSIDPSSPNLSGLTNPTTIAIICLIAIALYNVLELNVIICGTITKTRWAGRLYLSSLMTATWGIAPYAIGFLLDYLQLVPNMSNGDRNAAAYIVLTAVGWVAMVTGQSVVLYSRLYLLLPPERLWISGAVLFMILFDAIVVHGLGIIFLCGANSRNPGPFAQPFVVFQKVQAPIFFVQELLISGSYILEAVQLLRLDDTIDNEVFGSGQARWRRRILWRVICVNAAVILLGILPLALTYINQDGLQIACRALVYGIKLKLEISVLGQLDDLAQMRGDDESFHFGLEPAVEPVAPATQVLESTRYGLGTSVLGTSVLSAQTSHTAPKFTLTTQAAPSVASTSKTKEGGKKSKHIGYKASVHGGIAGNLEYSQPYRAADDDISVVREVTVNHNRDNSGWSAWQPERDLTSFEMRRYNML
jgi:hypothetical protein